MNVNIQEYLKDKILGNIKIGARDQNDRPLKYGYFNVHIDKVTSSLAVELFNEVYNKPKSLKIKFVNQNPIQLSLECYTGKKRLCYGNKKEAIRIDDKGKKNKIQCNYEDCIYAQEGKCKYIARLYFKLDKLEDEGIWCYPTGNQNGIGKMLKRIVRSNRIGEDITKNWYELFLTPEPSEYRGINYVPDIRKLELINDKENNINSNDSIQNKEVKNKSEKTNNLLMVMKIKNIEFNGNKAIELKVKDTKSCEKSFVMINDKKNSELKLKEKSIIFPISISKRDNILILNDYKLVKYNSDNSNNKKAV